VVRRLFFQSSHRTIVLIGFLFPVPRVPGKNVIRFSPMILLR
jgi:hypothetical protein